MISFDRLQTTIKSISCLQDGIFFYEKVQLSALLTALEERFHVKIICQPSGIVDHLFSGYLHHAHLDGALMSICYALGMRYEHQPAGVVLTRSA